MSWAAYFPNESKNLTKAGVCTQHTADAKHGLGVDLADAPRGQIQHGRNFSKTKVFLVVQGHHHALFFGKLFNHLCETL